MTRKPYNFAKLLVSTLFFSLGNATARFSRCGSGNITVLEESVYHNSAGNELIFKSFTCPALQARSEKRYVRHAVRDVQSSESAPVGVCPQAFEIFTQDTFHCDFSTIDQPQFDDCNQLNALIFDSAVKDVVVGPGQGIQASFGTCAFVFLNDDAVPYDLCTDGFADAGSDIFIECGNRAGNEQEITGFIRSVVQPGGQNWEIHVIMTLQL